MKGNPLAGAGYLIRGFGLIWQPGIKRFVVIPFLLSALSFFLIFVWLYGIFDGWAVQAADWLPGWLDWASSGIWLLFILTLLLSLSYLFTTVAVLVGAPFNGLLAEKIEHHLAGTQPPSLPWGKILAEMWANLVRVAQTLTYFLLFGIPLLILSFIPFINLLAVPAWLLFSAWYLGIQYLDTPMSNHRIPFSEVRTWAAHLRLTSLGFGGLTMIFTMIPLLNLLVVPAAVAGATAFWVEQRATAPEPIQH